MLFLTQTTFNVPSLMGALMTIGVATANSILVSFANESRGRETTKDAREAALIAGSTRLRPVCMTALAMIIGMLPMALLWARVASRTRRSDAPSSAGCCSLRWAR